MDLCANCIFAHLSVTPRMYVLFILVFYRDFLYIMSIPDLVLQLYDEISDIVME